MDWENLNWESLCDDLIKRLPKGAGAYAIRWAPNGKSQPIQRVFGPDKSGVLCFGMTGSLNRRSKEFYLAARGGNQQHAEGQRYYDMGYANHFPLQELQIGYRICNDEHEAWETEQTWFNEYESRFGESPPLNYGRGRRH
jgi:hypothetical protein